MTTVVSLQKGPVALLVGDLLVTADTPPPIRLDDLPTRFLDTQPPLEAHVVHLAQKVVQVHPRCAVAWAGRYETACRLIRACHTHMSNGHEKFTLNELASDLGISKAEMRLSTCVLYTLNPDSGTLRIDAFGTSRTFGQDGSQWLFGGSGGDHYIHAADAGVTVIQGPPEHELIRSAISSVSQAFYRELATNENHRRAYGGGFEVLLADSRAKSISKLPLAFINWTYDSSAMSNPRNIHLSGPIFTQTYAPDGYLLFDRFDLTSDDAAGLSRYVVESMLSDDAAYPNMRPNLDPYGYVHYLTDISRRVQNGALIISGGDNPRRGFYMGFSGGGRFTIEVDDTFGRLLHEVVTSRTVAALLE